MDMDPDLAVDPTLVAHTGTVVLETAQNLDLHIRGYSGVAVTPDLFGGLGDRLNAEFGGAAEDVAATLEGLVAVLQGDGDRLLRTAFAAQEAQQHSLSATTTVGVPG